MNAILRHALLAFAFVLVADLPSIGYGQEASVERGYPSMALDATNEATSPSSNPSRSSSPSRSDSASRSNNPSPRDAANPLLQDESWQRLPRDEGPLGGGPLGGGPLGGGELSTGMGLPLTTMASSLAIVLGLFAGFVWLYKKSPQGSNTLPSEVFQSIGRCSLAPKHDAVLVRCGGRVLLVSLSAGHGAQTLMELRDADEVDRLCALAAGGSSAAFGDVIRQMSRTPATRTFSA
jgi:flagellar biogenesis protein FliO